MSATKSFVIAIGISEGLINDGRRARMSGRSDAQVNCRSKADEEQEEDEDEEMVAVLVVLVVPVESSFVVVILLPFSFVRI